MGRFRPLSEDTHDVFCDYGYGNAPEDCVACLRRAHEAEVSALRDELQQVKAGWDESSQYASAKLEEARRELAAAIERAEGMKAEGCAAICLVENIFNGLTNPNQRLDLLDPVLREMAAACAKLLTEPSHCDHKPRAEAAEGKVERAKGAYQQHKWRDLGHILYAQAQEEARK